MFCFKFGGKVADMFMILEGFYHLRMGHRRQETQWRPKLEMRIKLVGRKYLKEYGTTQTMEWCS